MSRESSCVIVTKPGCISLERVTLPALEADEVLVRTTKTLISPGTERALLLNLPGLNVQYPKALGYSHVGEIVEIGEAVAELTVGNRVASRSRHASHVIAKADMCHKLPDHLADEQAVFFQLMAISLQALRKTRLEIGEAAAIIGSGLVGLLALQAARFAGALPTIAIDADEGRLARAKQLGADHSFNAAHAVEAIRAIKGLEDGLPVIIDASGNPAALESACKITAFGGRIALLGSSRGATESFDFYRQVHKRGITLIGAHISTTYRNDPAPGWWTLYQEQDTALRLLQNKRVAVAPLITHRYKHDLVEAAYNLLSEWNLDTIGIIIDWN